MASRLLEEEMERPEHVVRASRGSGYARAMTVPYFDRPPESECGRGGGPRRRAEAREVRELALLGWDKGA